MNILAIADGIASIVYFTEGKVKYAIQEERLAYEKNYMGHPRRSIDWLLNRISPGEIDLIAYAGKQTFNDYENRDTYVARYKQGFERHPIQMLRGTLKDVSVINNLRDQIRSKKRPARLNPPLQGKRTVSLDHHLCHAASAYYSWGVLNEPVLVFTCDGEGDRLSGSVCVGEAGKLRRVSEIRHNASLGAFFADITFLMGMIPHEHEYKVMGLAPYCKDEKRINALKEKFAKWFTMDPDGMSWRYTGPQRSVHTARAELGEMIKLQRFDIIGAAAQEFLEEWLLRWVKNAIAKTGIRKVCAAGGTFMNVKANQKIAELPEVDACFIMPSSGDETLAFGAAYLAAAENGNPLDIQPLGSLYLGDDIADYDVEHAVGNYRFQNEVEVKRCEHINREVAAILARGGICGRVNGRMEFGARALGNRSILACPNSYQVVRVINDMVKNRDFWMPFAPSVMAENVEVYFENPKKLHVPYMTFTLNSRPEKRSKMEAAIHPQDATGRVQAVYKDWNPGYYEVLSCYKELTGESLILNTSYNLHGLPIVHTPKYAMDVFDQSGLPNLALGDFLISKKNIRVEGI
ncbi:MAG: Decarbamoylnovobiocin carbamoyltransferase [Myxococcota bacterium]|nr:Decarbamoylnovobiocin carbamoyltransferase [Myxococcota bacterium]